ncbi:pectinesterase inhibitor 10-like [Musa acuminata AAA Group]|uniref:pectinesterase inhibitor 10-like n=1 Tax=Musa acuminata AAA Group TaxID=214697 RepID=UPI0031E08849
MMGGRRWNSAASATLVSLLIVFGFCISSCFTDATRIHADFIVSSCQATMFRRLCVDSLSPYANVIRDSHMELARSALSVSLSGARSAAAAVSKLAAEGTLAPSEAATVRDCMTTTGDSVDELQRSLEAIGNPKGKGEAVVGLRLDDIQTWVSAALTDEDTCMDGIGGGRGMGGVVKVAIRRQIVNVAQLTSNALALINVLNSASP